jgi:dTDP-4-dehydrorhamnose reductase
MSNHHLHRPRVQPLEIWGGLECTINRVLDDYFSQMERNGHAVRRDDLERLASLGIRAVRIEEGWNSDYEAH